MAHSNMSNAFVALIESPSADDLMDGRTEGKSLCSALELAAIPHSYRLAVTSDTLSKCLQSQLLEISREKQKLPILHISAHGNANGIGLADGTYVSWVQLRTLIAWLNVEMNGNLLICMSSCGGAGAGAMAFHTDEEPPYWKLIGNVGDVIWSDSSVGFTAFYHNLFKYGDVDLAYNAMCIASGNHDFRCYDGHEIKSNWANSMQTTNSNALSGQNFS